MTQYCEGKFDNGHPGVERAGLSLENVIGV